MNKKSIIAIVVAVLIATAVIVTVLLMNQPKTVETKKVDNTSATTTIQPATKDTSVTYSGVEGKTALELLRSSATVETSGEGDMAFVTSVNGVKADSTKNQFWSFNVNGAPASVGAGSYVTKNIDTITWKLDTF